MLIRSLAASAAVALCIASCATPEILRVRDPSVYPCGSPLLAYCPGRKTCCNADDQVCLMNGSAAGMCEDIAGGNEEGATRRPHFTPQVQAQ